MTAERQGARLPGAPDAQIRTAPGPQPSRHPRGTAGDRPEPHAPGGTAVLPGEYLLAFRVAISPRCEAQISQLARRSGLVAGRREGSSLGTCPATCARSGSAAGWRRAGRAEVVEEGCD